jgi:DNA helicase-2/ATP-dependent DNA helicase PcrA
MNCGCSSRRCCTHYQQRFTHLLVDEFQDTNSHPVRVRARAWLAAAARVFVVGDDDQSIYGWRGAKVENVQQFLRDSPGATHQAGAELPLHRQHPECRQRGDRAQPESPWQALWTAEAKTANDRALRRLQRNGRGALRGRAHPPASSHDGAASTGDAPSCTASNAQSRAFEEALIAAQVPYRVYGGLRFFERAEIKDTLAYLRLLANRADDAAFERAVNTPTRGIGERTVDEVRKRAQKHVAVACGKARVLLPSAGELAGRAKSALAASSS